MTSSYRLPEQLDIRVIADVHRGLLGALAASARGQRGRTAKKTPQTKTAKPGSAGSQRRSRLSLEVDAAGVERVDTAGVQLLAAVLLDAGPAQVRVADPAPCLVQAFEAAGLAHLLNSDKGNRHVKNPRGR
ncbi:MAG: STAS domain-containing protein [Gammaproteobacteria bacterium]|nr:STAS domain-containing protein [Gammaproteobacteria bacterium]